MTQYVVDAQGNKTHQLSEDGTEWIPLPSHPNLPPRTSDTRSQMDQLMANLGEIGNFDQNDPVARATNGMITLGPGNPGIESMLQGATLGFSDELQGLMGGDKEAIRAGLKTLPPGQKLTGELLGGIAGFGALGSLGKNIPVAGTNLTSAVRTAAQTKPLTTAAATGGLTGAVTGAGNAPDLGSTPGNAALGGLFGTVLGPGVQFSGQTAKRAVIDPLVKGFKSTQELSPKNLAVNQVTKALQRDEVDPDDIVRRLVELGPEAQLIDVAGPNLRKLAQSTINTPGKARTVAEKTLTERSNRSVNRLVADAKKLLGTDKNLFQATKSLVESRSKAATPLYQELRGQRPLLTDEFAEFMKRPSLDKAFKVGMRKARDEGVKIPSKLEAGNVIPFEVVDYTKRALDDKIGVAIRQGKKDSARQLMNLKNELTDFADTSFPGYKEARQVFTDHSAMLSAAQMGKNILRTDADEMTDLVSNLSNSEKQMFVVGAMKAITDKIKTTSEGGDSSRRFATQMIKDRIRPAFPDDESYNAFIQGLEREKIFQQSKGILGGSPTSERLSSEGAIASDIAVDAVTGNFMGTALNGIRSFLRSKPTIPENVRDEMGELIFSSVLKGQPLSNQVVRKLRKYKVTRKQLEDLTANIRLGVGFETGIQSGGINE